MLRIIIATSFVMIPTQAMADWQYTHWGMKPADVAKASSGKVKRVDGTPGDAVLDQTLGGIGTYTAASTVFKAEFFFSPLTNGLSLVKLTPPDRSCASLQAELTGRFGEPYRINSTLFSWRDATRNLEVRFADNSRFTKIEICNVVYRPLTEEAKSDL